MLFRSDFAISAKLPEQTRFNGPERTVPSGSAAVYFGMHLLDLLGPHNMPHCGGYKASGASAFGLGQVCQSVLVSALQLI